MYTNKHTQAPKYLMSNKNVKNQQENFLQSLMAIPTNFHVQNVNQLRLNDKTNFLVQNLYFKFKVLYFYKSNLQ